eukprot:16136-Heterococcus_DN1.PRE.1
MTSTSTSAVATVALAGSKPQISLSDKLNDLIVVTSSLVLIGSFAWVPAATYVVYKRYCKTRRRKIAFWIILTALLTVPLPECRRIRRQRGTSFLAAVQSVHKLERWTLWNRFLRYFSGRAIGYLRSDEQRQALYALVPHGIFPFGIGLGSLGKLNYTAFNSMHPVVASSILRMPVIGQILQMLGAVQANPESVAKALQDGKSLALAPGTTIYACTDSPSVQLRSLSILLNSGIGEIFCDADDNNEYALVLGRLGFVKRAIEAGVDIVPTFVFGNSATFKRAKLPAAFEKLS